MANIQILGIEHVIDELRRQNADLVGLLKSLSEGPLFSPSVSLCQFTYANTLSGWRNDSRREHEETLQTVRDTAYEQIPFNVQGVSGAL